MKPLLISCGEPAGIGPDICLELVNLDIPLVVMGDVTVLQQRAQLLGRSINFCEYHPSLDLPPRDTLMVWSVPCAGHVVAGELNTANVPYVLQILDLAVEAILKNQFSALITAPIHKEIINQAGIAFTGHTEYLAKLSDTPQVVMMLASETMRVALVTTHLPLSQVAQAITSSLCQSVINIIHHHFQRYLNITKPKILVAGLNPHAGEGGYLGSEEITTIIPALQALTAQGISVEGPYPADTLFNLTHGDVFVAMYHDQGLPVLKHASFGQGVNVTLGLPFIRTSVDHGTALSLAGTGQANADSLKTAVRMAYLMAISHQTTL